MDQCTKMLMFLGDSAELWITLNAMGYNAALEQDESSIFEVLLLNLNHRHS